MRPFLDVSQNDEDLTQINKHEQFDNAPAPQNDETILSKKSIDEPSSSKMKLEFNDVSDMVGSKPKLTQPEQ